MIMRHCHNKTPPQTEHESPAKIDIFVRTAEREKHKLILYHKLLNYTEIMYLGPKNWFKSLLAIPRI